MGETGSCSDGLSSVQSLSPVWLFVTPWTAARQASLSITNTWSLLKLMFLELVMPSNHLILCHLPLLLPSTFPSIRVYSSESVLHIRWPKYWSLSISPSNKYSGLISFRIDRFDLLIVQGTLQHHRSKVVSDAPFSKAFLKSASQCLKTCTVTGLISKCMIFWQTN